MSGRSTPVSGFNNGPDAITLLTQISAQNQQQNFDFQEVLRRQQVAIERLEAASSSKAAKFPLPKPFTEKSRPEDFIAQVRLFLKHSPAYPTEGAKCLLFLSLLQAGHADQWASTLCEDDSALLEDFEGLVKAFIKINPDVSVRLEDARKALHNMQMGPNQKFANDYFTEFSKEARASREKEEVLFFCLTNSLNERLTRAYRSHMPKPTKYDELCAILVSLDSGLSYEHNPAPKVSPAAPTFPQPMDLGLTALSDKLDNLTLEVVALKSRGRRGRRLTPEERQRRLNNNLCLICADPNHRKDDCPHRHGRGNGQGQ